MHLPECPFADADHDALAVRRCICTRLRACEARVREDECKKVFLHGAKMTEGAFRCRVCEQMMWVEEDRFFDGLGWAHPACRDEYSERTP